MRLLLKGGGFLFFKPSEEVTIREWLVLKGTIIEEIRYNKCGTNHVLSWDGSNWPRRPGLQCWLTKWPSARISSLELAWMIYQIVGGINWEIETILTPSSFAHLSLSNSLHYSHLNLTSFGHRNHLWDN
jgi:hypothetical protein